MSSFLLLTVISGGARAQFQSLALSTQSAVACGLTSAGRLYCWGENSKGQLGIGREGGHRASPTPVPLSGSIQAVTLGLDYGCALRDGIPLCWGDNEDGELGDTSHYFSRATPGPVMKADLRFRSLSAGWGTTCGIATSGETYCWGDGRDGQLGAGIRSDTPRGVLHVGGDQRFRMLGVGSGHNACGMTFDDVTYCWGIRLGRDDTVHYYNDVPVRLEGVTFKDVSVGESYACGLTADSLAYCWGYEGFGGLGDGHPVPEQPSRRWVSSPSPVVGGLRFTTISVGFRTTCALDANGRAYCWGYNSDGQVGDSTTIDRSTPSAVIGGYRFRELHAGGETNCGITIEGQTMCWGAGSLGQLGNGKTPKRSFRPVRVIDPSP